MAARSVRAKDRNSMTMCFSSFAGSGKSEYKRNRKGHVPMGSKQREYNTTPSLVCSSSDGMEKTGRPFICHLLQ